MDNLTHAALGGTLGFLVARSFGKRDLPLGRTVWAGAIAANLADLDVFIRSSHDPLMGLQYHRHFSHSLVFAPIVAGLTVAILIGKKLFNPEFSHLRRGLLFAAMAGALSHPLLDWQTSYGTQLLLPFSSFRAATDWIAIVDLFFTLPLLIGLLVALKTKRTRPASVGLLLSGIYFLLCGVQHSRALHAQEEIAHLRGQKATRGRALPMIGSFILWRSLYQNGDRYFSDAVRVPLLGQVTWKAGENVPAVYAFLPPSDWAPGAQERAARDFARFQFFAQGYTAEVGSTDGNVITDARYSAYPESFAPLWAIRFDPLPADQPTQLVRPSPRRGYTEWMGRLWSATIGDEPGYQPLYKTTL